MTTTVNGLNLRRVLGRDGWFPPEPFGPDGWRLDSRDGDRRIIVSTSTALDSLTEWTHASISRRTTMPTYEDLVELHNAVWGDTGWAYQVFAPASEHVNIHEHALHLWGRADGAPALPNFGVLGSI